MVSSGAFEAQCADVFENWNNIAWHRIIIGGQHQHIPDARDALAEDIVGGGLLRMPGPGNIHILLSKACMFLQSTASSFNLYRFHHCPSRVWKNGRLACSGCIALACGAYHWNRAHAECDPGA
jgi:hypothetical protein